MDLMPQVIWTSVVRACNELIEELEADPAYGVPIQFIDWDGIANEEELPNVDLLGPSGLGVFEESSGMFHTSFSIAGSTYGEQNTAFRQRYLMARIFDRVRVLKQLDLVDPTSAQVVGCLTIMDGTSLAPIERGALRPFQAVHVQAGPQSE